MSPFVRERLKRYLTTVMLRALHDGLSVEDVLDSLEGALQQRLRLSRGERSPRYRKELDAFYSEAILIVAATRKQIEKAGEVARAITGG